MDEIKEEIGARLKEFGFDKFKSLREFADALGISRANLNHYVNGHSAPGSLLVNKLALLGCDANWLLTGEVTDSKFSREKDEIKKELDEFWIKLKALGINNAEDLDKLYYDNQYMIFAKEAIEKAIKLKSSERKTTYSKVAEKKVPYNNN